MFWTVIMPSLEAGTWIGWAAARFGSRKQVQESLINGTRAVKTIAVVDSQLERETRSASPMQRKVAAGITSGIRFFAGTKACELAILKAVQERWAGAKQDDPKVRLHI